MQFLNRLVELLLYQAFPTTPRGICPVCEKSHPLQEVNFPENKVSLVSDHQTGLFGLRHCSGSFLLPVGAYQG